MTGADWKALSPLIAVAAGTLVVLALIAVRRGHGVTAGASLATLSTGLGLLPMALSSASSRSSSLLVFDGYTLFFQGLVLAAALVVVLLAHGYLKQLPGHREEFYPMLLLATTGAGVLVASAHFVSFFLGLELMSVSLYVLIGYNRGRESSLESALKYVILAAVSSAFILFGLALLYGSSGTMEWASIAARMGHGGPREAWTTLGAALLMTGLGFKLSLVPFHLWAPDVFQGAPAPASAFVATVSKGAVFALLLRLFVQANGTAHEGFVLVLSGIAIASMLVGNLLALLQDHLKRLLAYSSIAHMGYLLVAMLAGGELAVQAVAFYLTAYFVTMLGAFGVVAVLSTSDHDTDELQDYRGLFSHRPVLAALLSAMLLSLAGIPLTAGFVGKFYLIAAGVESSQWVLVLSLAVASVMGLYYYLRVIVALWSPGTPQPDRTSSRGATPLDAGLALASLLIVLLCIGVYPTALIGLLDRVIQP